MLINFLLVFISGVLIIATVVMFVNFHGVRNKLREKEALQTAAERICLEANDALFVINIVTGQIMHANHAAAELLGMDLSVLENKNIHHIFPPEYVARSSEVIADVWEKGGLVFDDLPLVSASGEHIRVECSGRVLPIGNTSAIVIYARDIRERLRMQRQIMEQKETIERKNMEITSSIRYAQRIQEAILPDAERLPDILPEHFVFYRPRDIVSGDFYVVEPAHDGHVLLAVADCTGHGVPGAFMSVLGGSLLKQALESLDAPTAAGILGRLDMLVTSALHYRKDEVLGIRDGMDITLCLLNPRSGDLQFAGAVNPLFLVEQNRGREIRGDKYLVGEWTEGRTYTNHRLRLEHGSAIYLWSDGLADQFGGPNNKKFKYSRLKELLVDENGRPMPAIGNRLARAFDVWKGSYEQIDDVCVVGLRV